MVLQECFEIRTEEAWSAEGKDGTRAVGLSPPLPLVPPSTPKPRPPLSPASSLFSRRFRSLLMAGLGAGLGASPAAVFDASRSRPLASPLRPVRSGKLIVPKRYFSVSRRLAWVEDELMEIRKSQEQNTVKSKKRPPLRRGKVSPQLPVPEHIPRPSYVGSKGLPELCKGQLHDAQGIAGMRAACKLAARVLDFAGTLVKPSVTTNEIDIAVHNMIIEAGAYPSPLGYRGFPKSICTSVNECVCHGVPDSTQLQNGDIINIDVNVFLNGYYGGTSRTFVCGQVDDSIKHFLKAAEECLEKGISVCRDGVNYRKIGKKISKLAYFYGYYVVERFVGHGIGTVYHSEPLILHYANENSGRMVEGQIFTIEPILTMEKTECVTWEDGWTTVTADGSWAAQFEHTILVTRNGAEILTKP